MIAKIFLLVFGLVSVYAGVDHAQKLKVLLQPANTFMRVEGQIVRVAVHVDRNPGRGQSPGANVQVYEVEFAYVAGGVAKTASALSPMCTYCERADVVRVLGREPDAVQKGTAVPVFVSKLKPDQAFLELARTQDIRAQVYQVLLWLVALPFLAYLFSKVPWTVGSSKNEEHTHD